MINHRENNIKTFAASLILVIVIAAFAVAGFMVFGGESPAEEDRFPWIVSDHAALNGMLDGTFYEGEKNSSGKPEEFFYCFFKKSATFPLPKYTI